MTTSFKKRIDALEARPGGARDVSRMSDDELWALLPPWWRTVPDEVFDELAILDRGTEEGRKRYRELKKMYGNRRHQSDTEGGC